MLRDILSRRTLHSTTQSSHPPPSPSPLLSPSPSLFLDTLQMAVSIGLCSILSLDHSLAATVSCILSAPEGTKINILSVLRVGRDPNSVSARESLRGLPGENVTEGDAKLLVRTVKSGTVLWRHPVCSTLPLNPHY